MDSFRKFLDWFHVWTLRAIIFNLSLFSSCNQFPEFQSKTTIYIQPFQGISQDKVRIVYEQVRKYYPSVFVLPAISLPQKAFYEPRLRYRADSLIAFLRSKADNDAVIIGVTNKDISHTKENIPDFGLMGLAYLKGPSAVISTFRLSKANIDQQLGKLALHELGHTQGLSHCNIKDCFMRDAEGKNHFNQLNDYCPNCKKKLKNNGWKF